MHDRRTQTRVLLDRLSQGDGTATERLFALAYDELRDLAAAFMRRERPDHTLQPTALVHEAYLRLVGQTKVDWQGKAHFFAVAANVIRRVLVDHARGHKAAKRGGGALHRVTLSDVESPADDRSVDLIALDEALERLAALSERQAQVVKLRFFGGLTGEETAYVLGVARSTVADDWAAAKAWLACELSQGESS